MLEKTIKQIITKKINEWMETIPNLELRKAIEKDLIITGGCFTSFIQNEAPNDYDCYFRTKETTIKVAEYYSEIWKQKHPEDDLRVIDCDKYLDNDELISDDPEDPYYYGVNPKIDKGRIKLVIPSNGVGGDPEEVRSDEELGLNTQEIIEEIDEIKADEIIEKEKEKYSPVFISTNAITLSNGVQIVVRFYGEPKDIHETYDFVHTKAYWDNGEKKLDIPKEVYEYTINKVLRYTGSRYPVCSVFRVRKFINRGWTINAGQLLKMCMQISDLDLNNVDILEDQLIGVDSLYFMQLIDQFRKTKEKDPDFKLTKTYIESIIDKIF